MKQAEPSVLVGEWSRTDGGYIIRVLDIKPDGLVDAEYLNPKAINIAEAWFMAPVSKRIVEFKMSLAKEPPIRLGIPDPYVPPKRK